MLEITEERAEEMGYADLVTRPCPFAPMHPLADAYHMGRIARMFTEGLIISFGPESLFLYIDDCLIPCSRS